jgi:histone H3/H4
MNGHGEKLSRLQSKAIAALLTAPTLADAACQVGVAERTLRNWLKVPAFKEAVKEAGKEMLGLTMSRLQGAAREATDTLLRSLKCGVPASEVRAAGLILDNAFKVADLYDLQERVAALEMAIGGKKNGPSQPN